MKVVRLEDRKKGRDKRRRNVSFSTVYSFCGSAKFHTVLRAYIKHSM
jgi:hypothetical protein